MNVPPPFPPEQQQAFGPIPNYLVWAILITIASLCLCCIVGTIPGVVAIVFATQVNGKLSQGDRDGAERASRNAKLWCWITTGLCILGLLINIAMYATGGNQKYMEMLQEMQARQAQQQLDS